MKTEPSFQKLFLYHFFPADSLRFWLPPPNLTSPSVDIKVFSFWLFPPIFPTPAPHLLLIFCLYLKLNWLSAVLFLPSRSIVVGVICREKYCCFIAVSYMYVLMHDMFYSYFHIRVFLLGFKLFVYSPCLFLSWNRAALPRAFAFGVAGTMLGCILATGLMSTFGHPGPSPSNSFNVRVRSGVRIRHLGMGWELGLASALKFELGIARF